MAKWGGCRKKSWERFDKDPPLEGFCFAEKKDWQVTNQFRTFLPHNAAINDGFSSVFRIMMMVNSWLQILMEAA